VSPNASTLKRAYALVNEAAYKLDSWMSTMSSPIDFGFGIWFYCCTMHISVLKMIEAGILWLLGDVICCIGDQVQLVYSGH